MLSRSWFMFGTHRVKDTPDGQMTSLTRWNLGMFLGMSMRIRDLDPSIGPCQSQDCGQPIPQAGFLQTRRQESGRQCRIAQAGPGRQFLVHITKQYLPRHLLRGLLSQYAHMRLDHLNQIV